MRKGDRLRVNTGDAIPTDGILLSGSGAVDESMLTGESEPVMKHENDSLTGATVLLSGTLEMKVTALGKETVLGKIIDLVKGAASEKSEIQRLADKISGVFVPIVILISLFTIPLGYFVLGFDFTKSLLNAIAVLVISCPCAMGLATPTAVMVGVGRAAKKGILIRGSRILETFAKAKYLVLDKTGTLTEGKLSLSTFEVFLGDKDEIAAAIKGISAVSSHPISHAVSRDVSSSFSLEIKDAKEQAGIGVEGLAANGDKWQMGAPSLLPPEYSGSRDFRVFVLKNGEVVAGLDFEDPLKTEVKGTINYFKEKDISLHLLSGDREKTVNEVADALGIQERAGGTLPDEKFEKIKSLKEKDITVMVGDGINDAAALAAADVGVSFTEASDVAMQTADLVLMEGDIQKLAEAHMISRHTLITIKQNLFWAFAYNVVAIPVAMLGFLNPMWGALFMAFSDVVVIGNSLRLRKKKLN